MPTRILAIDPGASGGLVELYPNGTAVACALPDDADLRDHVEAMAHSSRAGGDNLVCYLELVGGFVGGNPLPGSAMFNFGDGYGYIRGLLSAYRIETHFVR